MSQRILNFVKSSKLSHKTGADRPVLFTWLSTSADEFPKRNLKAIIDI